MSKELNFKDIEDAMRDYLIDNGWTPPEPEKEKIELACGEYMFNIYGYVKVHNVKACSPCGTVRQTKEQAEIASQAMLRRNKLSALAETVGSGEKEYDVYDYNYCVYYEKNTTWKFRSASLYSPCEVYMTQETAEAVCRVLNEGLFKL